MHKNNIGLSGTENHNVKADIPHLIHILTTHLGTDPCTPIREYISNAHDASIGLENPSISIWGEGDTLMILDKGTGMTKKVITDAFATIAGHLSQSEEEASVGMFGIGVLSAFMVAEKLEVITRSPKESHGWRLSWGRDEVNFSLEKFEKEEPGTLAILHLDDEKLDLARIDVLESYIKKTFALFPMPIFVGGRTIPINTNGYALNSLKVSLGDAVLVKDREVYELLRMSSNLDLRAMYYAKEMDGTRIFLGIPNSEHAPLDLHKVIFYSKGILVHGNEKAFFPTNLSFVVGLIDHPNFKVKMDREALFVQDASFKKLKASIEAHILNFLEIVASEDRSMIEDILHIHQTMLVAHGQKNKRLQDLFKKHYRFITSMGELRWAEVLACASQKGNDKIIYVASSAIQALQDLIMSASIEGFITVYAIGAEREILEQIAKTEGITIIDAAELNTEESIEVPKPFRELAQKISGYLLRKGIRAVVFVNRPKEQKFPAIFRIRTTQGKLMSVSPQNQQEQNSYTVDALMLNIANPLVQSLAGKKNLNSTMVKDIADTLYQIAVLHSPFQDYLLSITEPLVDNLVKYLHQVTGSKIKTTPENGAKCFVAFPYSPEYNSVWEGVSSVLKESPYYWEVIRGDQHIDGEHLLENIRIHLQTSHRFIADISGLNANVLIELGLMLTFDAGDLLILCDKDTYKRLPSDLGGVLILTYPKSVRENTKKMKKWFAENVIKHKAFLAIAGIAKPVQQTYYS